MLEPRVEVLEYAPANGPESRTKWSGVIALVISLPSTAVVFLDFAEGISPWNVASAFVFDELHFWSMEDWQLALCAAPFFLAFPLMWLGIRSIFSAKLSGPESIGVWSLVGLSACATLIIDADLMVDFFHYHNGGELVAVGLGFVIGAPALIFCRRRRLSAERSRPVGLYICYVANGVICLIAFAENKNLGWYVSLVIVCGMCAELMRLLFAKKQPAMTVRL
jgi:hypothetical protein